MTELLGRGWGAVGSVPGLGALGGVGRGVGAAEGVGFGPQIKFGATDLEGGNDGVSLDARRGVGLVGGEPEGVALFDDEVGGGVGGGEGEPDFAGPLVDGGDAGELGEELGGADGGGAEPD